jgi:hypothetical protein
MAKVIIRTMASTALLATTIFAPLGLSQQSRGRQGVALADTLDGSPTPCSDASLQGAYAGQATGFILNGPDGTPLATPKPFAVTRAWTLDGAGNGTLNTENPVTGTATYSVNADCTGTWTEMFSSGQTTHLAFVVLGGGTSMLMAGTDPGLVVSFSLTLLP